MDRRQRFADAVEQFRSAFEGSQSDVWTTLPGRIESVDFDKMTVNVQPTLMALVTNKDGSTEWIELPLLLDCPIVFPNGGGFSLTFPLEAGDEVMVSFSSRCIDNWWAQSGGTGPSGAGYTQAELRMHSLSDGFAVPGPRNTSRVIPDISTTDVQLRNDALTAQVSIRANSDVYVHSDANVIVDADGDVFVQAGGDIHATATGAIDANAASVTATISGALVATCGTANITATATATVAAPAIALTGAVAITGSLAVNGKDFTSHVHTPGGYHIGGSSVTGNSGAPV